MSTIECGICLLQYNEEERTPRMLAKTVQSISNQFDMMKKEAIHKLTQFANERKEEQTALKTRLEDECSELKKVQDVIEKKLKMKNDLQNRDEITCLKKSYRSRCSSQDAPIRFLNYEFLVPKTELQIKTT
ncbi:hypothetical protein CAEBREN_16335 [Caenorhabditis brenneri]|uniref:Uncharacterized protein n=1 Tax=Caenorhabditis brenneri TaxID=135651 RepID=G0PG19_CAEBE|nr:hypothetical protein CAEBREN_16335 [Caenorhabditis brenneri]